MALVCVPVRSFVERRWRWSWLWMRWTVNTLVEDYQFRWNGDYLEGIEPWQ
jgi:hypothetical protein